MRLRASCAGPCGEKPRLFHPDDADHAPWQADLDYWQAELHGPLPVLDLRSRGPGPRRRARPSATVSFEFDAAQAMALREFCEREQVAPFVMLLAAYQVRSYRYSGEERCRRGLPLSPAGHLDDKPLDGLPPRRDSPPCHRGAVSCLSARFWRHSAGPWSKSQGSVAIRGAVSGASRCEMDCV